MKYKIDINILDDHAMFADGLTEVINARSECARVSHQFANIGQCETMLAVVRPDVLLVDLFLPDGDGIDFCQRVKTNYPKVKVLALTAHDEYSVIKRAIDSGIDGYILKNASIDELLRAIAQVYRGENFVCAEAAQIMQQPQEKDTSLSNVECHVLELICQGFTNQQIAAQVCLSQETVNWYRKRLLAKLNVKNTAELVAFAVRQHLV